MKTATLLVAFALVSLTAITVVPTATAMADPFPTCIRDCSPVPERPCVIGSSSYCIIRYYCFTEPCPDYP